MGAALLSQPEKIKEVNPFPMKEKSLVYLVLPDTHYTCEKPFHPCDMQNQDSS
jgi:hypothetical protein